MKRYLLMLVLVGLACQSGAVTFTVTSREDSGPGTLRDAIAQANATDELDTIVFNTGGNSITVFSGLNVTKPVFIDGYSTQIIGTLNNALSIVILEFQSGSDNSTVQNLAIINSSVALNFMSNNNRVYGCRIGTDWNDRSGIGNTLGILLIGSNNIIGASNNSQRNIISGNSGLGHPGIDIASGDNRVINNYIGTNSSGTSALPNGIGIKVDSGYCDRNLIGGNYLNNEGNLISGNTYSGILFDSSMYSAQGNTIAGNIIGLNAAQTSALPNQSGIVMQMGITDIFSINYIGLPQNGCGNIVAGNLNDVALANKNPKCIIQNNLIGLNSFGAMFSSDAVGLVINTFGNLIGGINPYERNYICCKNALNNLALSNGGGNTIVGNYIGVLPNGTVPSTTVQYGIQIAGNSTGNMIGLKWNGKGNLISGCQEGIYFSSSTTNGNSLFGNTICSFSNNGILFNGALGSAAPAINSATTTLITGSSQAYDYIEVFKAEPRAGLSGGSLIWIGGTSATAAGSWSLIPQVTFFSNEYVCALATDAAGHNTSSFSNNTLVLVPTHTPTSTRTSTPTITPTSTISPTCTVTPTSTSSPTPFPWSDSLRIAFGPNPVRGSMAHLNIFTRQGAEVEVKVFTTSSREVNTFKYAYTAAGRHVEELFVGDLANGIYLVRVNTKNADGTEDHVNYKMALIK